MSFVSLNDVSEQLRYDAVDHLRHTRDQLCQESCTSLNLYHEDPLVSLVITLSSPVRVVLMILDGMLGLMLSEHHVLRKGLNTLMRLTMALTFWAIDLIVMTLVAIAHLPKLVSGCISALMIIGLYVVGSMVVSLMVAVIVVTLILFSLKAMSIFFVKNILWLALTSTSCWLAAAVGLMHYYGVISGGAVLVCLGIVGLVAFAETLNRSGPIYGLISLLFNQFNSLAKLVIFLLSLVAIALFSNVFLVLAFSVVAVFALVCTDVVKGQQWLQHKLLPNQDHHWVVDMLYHSFSISMSSAWFKESHAQKDDEDTWWHGVLPQVIGVTSDCLFKPIMASYHVMCSDEADDTIGEEMREPLTKE